jgi:uncharacterized protein YqeY
MLKIINMTEREVENYIRLIIVTNNYSPIKDIGKIIDSFHKEYGVQIEYKKLSQIVLNILK